jgi:threonine/homoserine/homoserine lactone efflux protein
MAQHGNTNESRAGQRVALIVAATGVLWVLANLIGAEYNWSNRVQGLFDLAALAGFGFALWQTYQLWRARQQDKGDS